MWFVLSVRKAGKGEKRAARGPLHGFCARLLQDQAHDFLELEFKMGFLILQEPLHFQNQEKIRNEHSGSVVVLRLS